MAYRRMGRLWNWIKRRGKLRYSPGWAIGLCGVFGLLGVVDAITAIGERVLSDEVISALQPLGPWLLILFGFAWLVLVGRSEQAMKHEDDERHRAMADLRVGILGLLQRFEGFCQAYEHQPSLADRHRVEQKVVFAKLELDYAIASVIRSAIATTPLKERHRYNHLLRGVLLDYFQHFSDSPRSILSESSTPDVAIKEALGLTQPTPDTEESQPPPDDA